MGLFSGFPFTTRQNEEEQREQMEKRVFPHGTAQREQAQAVLDAVVQRKTSGAERLFLFISTKDRYLLAGKDDAALQKAAAGMKQMRWLPKQDARRVLALVVLDAAWDESEPYPQPSQVEALAQDMP